MEPQRIKRFSVPRTYIKLVTTFVLIGFQVCEQAVVYSAFACANPSVVNSPACILLHLDCLLDRRIWIINGYYGYRDELSSSDINNCGSACFSMQPKQCCEPIVNDSSETISQANLDNVKHKCDSKTTCTPQAPFKGNLYSWVEYQCITEIGDSCETDQNCFDLENAECKQKQCICLSGYKGNAGDEKCVPKVVGDPCKPGYGSDQQNDCATIDHSQCKVRVCSCKPGYEGWDGDAHCLSKATESSRATPNQNSAVNWTTSPLTTELSTQSLTVTSATSSGATYSTTLIARSSVTTVTANITINVSSASSTGATQIINPILTDEIKMSTPHSSVLDVHAEDSDDVPVAAVVVPLIVFLLLGSGTIIIVWRKRCARNSEIKYPSKNNSRMTKPDNAVHNAAYSNTPTKTSDNYILLESENTYTYIDHTDIQSKDSQDPKFSRFISSTVQMAQVDSGYIAEKSAICSLSERKGNKSNLEKSNDANGIVNISNNSSVNGKMLSPDSNINYNNENSTSHDYFILETQDLAVSTTETSKPNCIERKLMQNAESSELEQHNMYSSIDPESVTVQTLPENEYNITSLKGKIITRDSNYCALNAGFNYKNVKDNSEYSHFQKLPDARSTCTIKDYSQVKFNKFEDVTSGNTEEQDYSTLATSYAEKPTVDSGENDDYSNLKMKIG